MGTWEPDTSSAFHGKAFTAKCRRSSNSFRLADFGQWMVKGRDFSHINSHHWPSCLWQHEYLHMYTHDYMYTYDIYDNMIYHIIYIYIMYLRYTPYPYMYNSIYSLICCFVIHPSSAAAHLPAADSSLPSICCSAPYVPGVWKIWAQPYMIT